MKKILILAYYYPPCVGIAANRPAAFANDFSQTNEAKVVTRHWLGTENQWEDYLISVNNQQTSELINERLEVIRTPYQSKLKKPNKLRTFCQLLAGKLDPEIDATQLLLPAQQLLSRWKPDVILVSSPPLNIVQVGASLSKQFNIPLIADFRDFENDFTLNPTSTKTILERLKFSITKYYTKKLCSQAVGITAINQEFCTYLGKLTNKPTRLIFNGFEASIFSKITSLDKLVSTHFSISIIGTVYENQEYEIFLKAFKKVIEALPNGKIQFNFIGTETIPEIGQAIRESIPASLLNLTPRINRNEALIHLANSHLVWQPEMVGFTGVYSGKIFEYLGAKRIILVAPSQGDVLDVLLQETNAGFSFETAESIAEFIIIKYREWEISGFIPYEGNDLSIQQYSRENQSLNLLHFINQFLP